MSEAYFLPYQLAWLSDKSRIKICEKSRRVGMTYTQAFEDVDDCITGRNKNVWVTTADLSAAKEYISYCAMWALVFNVAAEDLGEIILDSQNDIKALCVEFSNGSRINAISSNPKAFRSKGGKVVIDEFAFHDNPKELWRAAKPVITWGDPLRILSSHNGENSLFNEFVNSVKNKKLKWSLHTIDIYKAVEQGLADKIIGNPLTKEQRQAWIDEERENCADDTIWKQEYECIPMGEASVLLPYDLIRSVESSDILKDLSLIKNDLYLGVDIGRTKHLTVFWLLEKIALTKYTRYIHTLENAKFSLQRELLYQLLSHKKLRRCCIDKTGLGMQLAEEAQLKFGKNRVEPVLFTNTIKEELAFSLKQDFEDKTTIIPSSNEIREDLHSVRIFTTTAGNIRLDTMNDKNGHADRFWALALADHAADNKKSGIPLIKSKPAKNSKLKDFVEKISRGRMW